MTEHHNEHFSEEEEAFFKRLERAYAAEKATTIKISNEMKRPILDAIQNILDELGLGAAIDPRMSHENLQAIWRELYIRKKHRIHKAMMASLRGFKKKKKLGSKTALMLGLIAICIFLVKSDRCMAFCIPLISFPRPSLGMGR